MLVAGSIWLGGVNVVVGTVVLLPLAGFVDTGGDICIGA